MILILIIIFNDQFYSIKFAWAPTLMSKYFVFFFIHAEKTLNSQ